VVRLSPAESSEDLWSWSPLATHGRIWVLASRGAPTVPNELALGKLEEYGGKLGNPSRCRRLLLAVSTLQGSIGRTFLVLMAVLPFSRESFARSQSHCLPSPLNTLQS
jgi:hypothetical protein